MWIVSIEKRYKEIREKRIKMIEAKKKKCVVWMNKNKKKISQDVSVYAIHKKKINGEMRMKLSKILKKVFLFNKISHYSFHTSCDK